jgi:V8-like Glu-specific endopeptidase
MIRFRVIQVLVMALTSVAGAVSAADGDPYTIRFTEDDKLRTSLNWINLRPDVIHPSSLPVAAVQRGLARSPKADQVKAENLRNYPEAVIGKLLFVKPSGEAGSCTATFVTTNRVLLTAANCIINKDAGDAATNTDFIFVSNYGSVTQQAYGVDCVAFPSGWLGQNYAATWRFNYAFLRTTNTNTFGGLGLTNALAPTRLNQVGFADDLHEGLRILSVDSDAYMTKDGLVATAFTTLGAGSSGNPWMRNSIVHSISSHYDPEQPDIVLGPRITGTTMKILQHVGQGCPAPVKQENTP